MKETNEKLQNIINKLRKEKREARIIVLKSGKIIILTENTKTKK